MILELLFTKRKLNKRIKLYSLFFFSFLFVFLSGPEAFGASGKLFGKTDEKTSEEKSPSTVSEEKPDAKTSSVEIIGDKVEFLARENKVLAQGNVAVKGTDVTLFCDRLEFFRDTKIAIAEGHVVMQRGEGRMKGEKMKYNFDTMKGDFLNTRIMSDPLYGEAQKVSKIGENHIRMERGYITMCDLDQPHFKFVAKKVDIYPKQKAVSRNVRLVVGKLPLIYIPKFVQDLRGKEPVVLYTPGYDKDWGMFLLTRWRYQLTESIKGTVHLDFRERKDVASGVDMNYKTSSFGDGMIRTYYMNERNITAKRFFQPRPSPTIEKERFRALWRHKWSIDDRTSTMLQYGRLSDPTILKDYFKREYETEGSPSTYFVLSRSLTAGSLSFNISHRTNRFESAVEKLPEISYGLTSTEFYKTGLYIDNSTKYSNFVKKSASPSEIRQKTSRIYTRSELSYPMKVSFIELRPFVNGSETYYSRMIDPAKHNSIRGIFGTGASLSTKFYRIFEPSTNILGVEINKLRHIITPSISYGYTHPPTIPDSEIEQYDTLDAGSTLSHSIGFSLENKFQTKRNNSSLDLLRVATGSGFLLKESAGKGGFNNVTAEIDVTPYPWLSGYSDYFYNTQTERLETMNFDVYINGAEGRDKWYFNLGRRWTLNADDQFTTDLGYAPNHKWKFRLYHQFDVVTGLVKVQEYNIRRDLHCWTMDLNFNQTRGQGSEIWLVFTLKSFPEIGFDIGTSFNKRKPGSQVE